MIAVKEIKKDDVFYECEYGMNVKFMALENAYEKKGDPGYWTFRGRRIKTGEIVEFGSRDGFSHYGPKLYREPEYVNPRTFKAKID